MSAVSSHKPAGCSGSIVELGSSGTPKRKRTYSSFIFNPKDNLVVLYQMIRLAVLVRCRGATGYSAYVTSCNP